MAIPIKQRFPNYLRTGNKLKVEETMALSAQQCAESSLNCVSASKGPAMLKQRTTLNLQEEIGAGENCLLSCFENFAQQWNGHFL